jgi:hypothetical protein
MVQYPLLVTNPPIGGPLRFPGSAFLYFPKVQDFHHHLALNPAIRGYDAVYRPNQGRTRLSDCACGFPDFG